MVGSRGLEPPTSRLSGVRSNHLSYEPIFDPALHLCCAESFPETKAMFEPLPRAGGDNRDRTDDPLLAKQVLSQLSYTPAVLHFSKFVPYEPQKLNNDLT